jgi:outer membrane protein TolC
MRIHRPRDFRLARTSLHASLIIVGLSSLIGCRSHCMVKPIHSPAPVEWQSGGKATGPTLEVLPTRVLTTTTLDLADCLRLASEKQPKIHTQRASLATAVEGKRALDTLRIPASLSAQIPHRRKQAGLIVVAASGALEQLERETAYAVTRSYITVLFAREQESVSRRAVERLSAIKEAAEKALELGARDVTAADVARALVYLRMAETKHIQASQGVKRAQIALREAIGLGPEVVIDAVPDGLPETTNVPDRYAVVAVALARRGEIVQANALAQITCIEADAQATSLLQRMETFAAGIDIHSTQIPQANNGVEYRPGGLPPEMPTLLLGTRQERLKQVQSLIARADQVVATTRNLVAAEVDDAFLRWEEASQQARKTREAAAAADKLADELRKDFAAGLKVKADEVVAARVLALQVRADFNEYVFKLVIALADLERATSGGFSAGLVDKK